MRGAGGFSVFRLCSVVVVRLGRLGFIWVNFKWQMSGFVAKGEHTNLKRYGYVSNFASSWGVKTRYTTLWGVLFFGGLAVIV